MTPRQAEGIRTPRPTPRAAVRGCAALLVLAALLAGLPVLLYRLGGSPIPASLPSLHQIDRTLLHRDTGAVFLAAVRDVSWLAWAAFAIAVLTEVVALARRRASPRLRLGPVQDLAARLVAVVAVSFAAAPAGLAAAAAAQAAPAAASQQPGIGHDDARAVLTADQSAAGADRPLAAAAGQVRGMDFYQMVTVRPGDCLWLIAQRYLGNGDRYPEIVALNIGKQMADGQVFSNPSLIWPGWVLQVPALHPHGGTHGDAEASHHTAGQREHGAGGDAGHRGAHHQEPGRHHGHHTSDHRFGAAHPSAQPSTSPLPASSGAAGERPAGSHDVVPARQPKHGIALPELAAFGFGVLAGGAAASLASMRHRQRQARRRGRRIPLPADPQVIETERRMRAASDDAVPSWRAALGSLGEQLMSAGELPEFTAVRMLPDSLELLLASPAAQAPPWPAAVVAGRLGSTWRLGLATAAEPGTEAPADLLPGLVTLGEIDGGHLLIDLEHLQVTTVTGEPAQAEALLRSAAAELATGELAGWYDLILVGFPELGVLGGRGTCCDSVAEAISLLAARTDQVRARLGDDTAEDLRWHRLAEPQDEDWALTVLVSGEPPTPEQLDELTGLASWPGGVAALVPGWPGEDCEAPASIELTSEAGQLVARVWPLQLEARLAPLSEDDYAALVGLFDTAAAAGDVGPDEPPYDRWSWPAELAQATSEPAGEPAWPADGDTGARVTEVLPRPASAEPADPAAEGLAGPASSGAALRIGVLGSLTVNGQPGTLLPAQSQLLLALALHGAEGLSNQQLCYLLGADPDHPKPTDSLRQLIVRTRRQLGLAADAREWIVHLGGGQYALHPDARFDWDEFDTLASRGLTGRDARALREALGLIRGQPFTGCYYWWLDPALTETVRAQIVDTADLLAELEAGAGKPAAAARAARIGLAGDTGAEQLWRALMRAEHAAGNLMGVREAWRRCLDAISEIAPDGEPHEDTAALYYKLLSASSQEAAWAGA
jgi:DNA-binding SARP family transcriptional activator